MKEIKCYYFQAVILADIQLVSDCLNQDEHVLQWNDQIIENIFDGKEEDLAEGSTYITRQKLGKKIYTLPATYTTFNPPHHVAVSSKTKEGLSKTEYTLTEYDGGTVFTVEVTLIPANSYYKFITNLMKWSFKYVYDDQFQKFIDYVSEQASKSSSDETAALTID
ncbi:SRPBCC domain-containing protein [Gracilibacillus salinarum]|uniref:SRPBCC domain-containing protein n=1 Tax=Gracilibacillus salinarum TaxID=2932255 RepID=A0ABY4GS36_9BACI|nr:SRPBCC domain-containing protein [Gracilibacillus salinarum]UOQ86955.1 SRPBCC domain-containing protein [Gracilibacillus salinarum]